MDYVDERSSSHQCVLQFADEIRNAVSEIKENYDEFPTSSVERFKENVRGLKEHLGADLILVRGAGIEGINGVYTREGTFKGAGLYTKRGKRNNVVEKFSLFRCIKFESWYISIVPNDSVPGTNKDIDFYGAPFYGEAPSIPPEVGWAEFMNGIAPSPIVEVLE